MYNIQVLTKRSLCRPYHGHIDQCQFNFNSICKHSFINLLSKTNLCEQNKRTDAVGGGTCNVPTCNVQTASMNYQVHTVRIHSLRPTFVI